MHEHHSWFFTKEYIKDLNFKNIYGETIKWKFLGACEAYEMFDPPKKGMEVFSSSRVIDKNMKDKEILKQIFGPDETDDDYEKRTRFLHGEILSELVEKMGKKN